MCMCLQLSVAMYHISSNRCPGIYFLRQIFAPASKRGQPLLILVREALYNNYYSWQVIGPTFRSSVWQLPRTTSVHGFSVCGKETVVGGHHIYIFSAISCSFWLHHTRILSASTPNSFAAASLEDIFALYSLKLCTKSRSSSSSY